MFQTYDVTTETEETPFRLAALRAELDRIGIDGFLVPRADAHQGENVAPRDQRLAWLTGFTGSAGIAIVLKDRAAVFADGRYTLQVAQQVDASMFEAVPIHQNPPQDWLRDVLTGGERIGFDPWLHGKAEIDRIEVATNACGAQLVPLPNNPLDAVWIEQPAPPSGAVRIHDSKVAGEPADRKRTRIGTEIQRRGARSAILTLPDSIAWLLNIRGSDIGRSPVAQGFAVLHENGHVDLVMDPDKLDGTVHAHLGNAVTVHPPEGLASLVKTLKGPILLDNASCPVWFAHQLEQAGIESLWGADPCIAAKARKNNAELEGMRAAHLRDGASMVRFLRWLDQSLQAGKTLSEIDIAAKLEQIRAENGDLQDISFETICGSGPNGAIVHYRVTRDSNRTLTPGELLLIDSGAQYPDGTTDITRTLATGPVDPAARRQFTLVLKGMIAISHARWPVGLRGRDLDPLARAALWRSGFDYDHGTGHGVGACLNVHEGPQSLSRRGEAVLEPGMILSNEPGYYVEGSHGIRIENLVVVLDPTVPEGGVRPMLGFETLTWCPIDRRLIDPMLLDDNERIWLNAYHADVVSKLKPFLCDEDMNWLKDAAAPV